MNRTNKLKVLYIVVFTLLIVHEIDSAFWKEWELFHIPGGIQVFNVIHIVVLPIFIIGYGVLIDNVDKGIKYSFLLSILGILAFIIHSIFMSIGFDQFKIPVSILIITFLGLTSVYQLILLYKVNKNLRIADKI